MSAESRTGVTVGAPKRALPPSTDLTERVSRSPFLVALDIDGTIAPIAPTPDVSAVPAETRRTLERLARAHDVHLAFVTGRGALDGRRLVDVTHSWTIGNHGIELIDPTGALRVNELAESFAPTIAQAAKMLAEPLAAIRGAFIEDKTWTLSVHVRLAARAEVPAVERALTEVAQRLELRLHHGKEIYELRPPIAIDKGTALLDLAAALGVSGGGGSLDGSLLYAGDDKTDEDAFRALRARQWNTVTVHIGEGVHTDAEFVLSDPPALGDLLDWLASMRERRTTST